MYLDPPYPDNGANYAHNMREWAAHRELAERLKHTQCKWILSSYDIPEIREMFGKHFIISVQSSSGMSVKKNDNSRVPNKEVLVTNFAPPKHLPHGQIRPYQLALDLEHPVKERRLVYKRNP